MHIVTLTTCHNRRDCTLAALSDLHDQEELPNSVVLSHVIVDDGSTDGTKEAVRERFPDTEIVEGDGRLFWAGGMRHGWKQSIEKKKFDYLFVYNDDAHFFKAAICELLQVGKSLLDKQNDIHVIAGSFKDSNGKITTYGGRRRSSKWHPLKFTCVIEPNGTTQKADTLNMNGALISATALRKVGFLSEYFIHSGADFEYGLKLVKAGGAVYVTGKHVGTCDLNTEKLMSNALSLTLKQRLKLLNDIKREPFRQRLEYYRRHGGLFWPIFWVSPYVTVWLRYVWSSIASAKRSYRGKII